MNSLYPVNRDVVSGSAAFKVTCADVDTTWQQGGYDVILGVEASLSNGSMEQSHTQLIAQTDVGVLGNDQSVVVADMIAQRPERRRTARWTFYSTCTVTVRVVVVVVVVIVVQQQQKQQQQQQQQLHTRPTAKVNSAFYVSVVRKLCTGLSGWI